MNRLLKIYILLLFNKILLQLHIKLSSKGDYYGVDLVLGEQNKEYFLIFDTSIPKTLIASPNCTKCNKEKYDPTLDSSNKLIQENSKQVKDSFDYYGDEYRGLYAFSDEYYTKYNFTFLSVMDIDIISEMNIAGYFSIFNQFFYNTPNFISFIGMQFDYSKGYLDIDTTNKDNYNYSLATNYTINIDNSTKEWYLSPSTLNIRNRDYNISNQFYLKFDSTIWTFKIPKKFYFDNIEIFEDYGCRVTYYGIFLCDCTDKSYNVFPTFLFTFNDNNTLQVVPTDYLSLYDDGASCEVHIEVNHENDFFIGGLNVLNNFYTVIDFQNKILSMTDLEREFYYANPSFVLKFIFIFFISGVSFYLIYTICTKCYNRARAREMDQDNEAEVL